MRKAAREAEAVALVERVRPVIEPQLQRTGDDDAGLLTPMAVEFRAGGAAGLDRQLVQFNEAWLCRRQQRDPRRTM
jgi:hypothetical protein